MNREQRGVGMKMKTEKVKEKIKIEEKSGKENAGERSCVVNSCFFFVQPEVTSHEVKIF
mgnify:CR=1 FL=1